MDSIKLKARQAKQRLKSNFWDECKRKLNDGSEQAKILGINENKVQSYVKDKVRLSVSGEKDDEFYLRVKDLIDSEGEVSDAIGRLTDRELYEKLSYAERQRYNLELSANYLRALEKYRKEKEMERVNLKN